MNSTKQVIPSKSDKVPVKVVNEVVRNIPVVQQSLLDMVTAGIEIINDLKRRKANERTS